MNRLTAYLTLTLLLAAFLAVNILTTRALPSARLDLTQNNLYTLSPAGRAIARSPKEPITLTLFYSESLVRGQPQIQSAATRVIELLESFESASRGKIDLRIVDPEPFSEAEDDAVARGIRGVRIGPEETLYFGLVGTNALDGRETIPYINALDPNAERFLEYEFAKLIHTLAEPDRPSVGVITSLPLLGTPPNPMTRSVGAGPWQVITEIETTLDLRELEPDNEGNIDIPEDIDVLMLAHPKNLSGQTLFAIDQFALKGGKILAFLDPHAEADPAGAPDPQNPMAALRAETSSDLGPLLEAWGVSMPTDRVAGDLTYALEVSTGGPRGDIVPFVVYLALRGEAFDKDDPVLGRLGVVNMASAGMLSPIEGATTTFEPFITTTDQSAPVTADRIKLFPDPRAILNDFFPTEGTLALAARVTGDATTAFPDGPPTAANDADDETPEPLTANTAPLDITIVADADLLADRFWVRALSLGGLNLGYERIADNGALVAGLLDRLAGSDDLLALRARGEFRRPFTRIEEMRRQAEAEFRAEEQRLEQQIEQTQQRINDLQLARTDDPTASLVLSPEQQAELDRLEEQLVASRRQLRQVRLDLRRDIEALQTRLQLINTAAVPVLLAAFAVSLAGFRAIRRRADRRRGADS